MDGQDKNNIVRRVSPVDATTHETSQRARPTVFFPFFFFFVLSVLLSLLFSLLLDGLMGYKEI